MNNDLWFNKAGNTGQYALPGKTGPVSPVPPIGPGKNNNNQQALVSCNACNNGYPVGITQAAPGQCPVGSSESKNPCTMIQCYACGAGNNPVSVGMAYPMDPLDGCNPTGNGPSTSNPNGGCSTTPPPTITCYECLNGVAQGRSYIGMSTCPHGETTDPNPCTSTGPALQDDCYNCSSGTMHRVARGTCVNAPDVMVAQVDQWSGVSHNPCPATQLLGCTDASATNFNPLANTDDGSCVFPIPGCTDMTATNYNAVATADDGSCTFSVPGCTDTLADNYNPVADTDDGTCTYPVDPLQGCMDSTADNYNDLAELDDGTCTYEDDIEEEIEEIDDEIKTAGLAGDNKMLMYIAIGIGVILLMKK